MNGIINFYKPEGMTSHDAVNYIRKLLNTKKVGHSGTLDPNATGVLPICVGKATRIAEYLLEADKEYIGELTLGYSTDTQDKDGEIIEKSSRLVEEEDIIKVFNRYKGRIEQKPPMYSALKHNGKKLYELAREGITVERKLRPINIYKLEILKNKNNKIIKFYVKCSKGTYVRTLCNDIGEDLGTKGHMSNLVRVGVGNFKIKDSITMDELDKANLDAIEDILYPIDYAINNFNKLVLNDNYYKMLINGSLVPINYDSDTKSLHRVYCRNTFIGIGEIINIEEEIFLKMKKVFAQGG